MACKQKQNKNSPGNSQTECFHLVSNKQSDIREATAKGNSNRQMHDMANQLHNIYKTPLCNIPADSADKLCLWQEFQSRASIH